MPPGNSCFLTPSVTPRPPNRPRKTGKLTPGKNPVTLGSAGRSDPARDACGRPRAFHLLVFHTSHHCWFLGKPFVWWEVKSWRILHLCWRLFSGLGCFLSFLPNWALCGPNRPLTGRGRVRSPTWGETRPKRASWGRAGGLGGFAGTGFGAVVFRFQCRKERKGRTIPLEGGGQDLRHLMGIFSRVQEGNVQGCTLELLHNM